MLKVSKIQIMPLIKLHLILLLCFFSKLAIAQPYANEWIDYNQMYFKFSVVDEGIYRVTHSTLQQAGVPTSNIDPRSFQLFYMGDEQHIYVHNESTGVFSSGDYIEFYGKGNKGALDAQLYNTPGTHANPYHSLFNDTATYFLTWTTSINNRRLTIEDDINFHLYNPMPYFIHKVHQNYASRYFPGETNIFGETDAEYVTGEGWFNAPFGIASNIPTSITKTIPTPNVATFGPDASVSFTVVGASTPPHHLNVTFANQVVDTIYSGFKVLNFNRNIPLSQMGSSVPFTFTAIDDLGSSADRSTIAFVRLKYPQSFNLNNSSTYKMRIPEPPQSKALLEITNFNIPASDSAFIYDLTNNKRVRVVKQGNTFRALVPKTPIGGDKVCYITSYGQINYINNVVPVNASPQNFAKFTDFTSAPANNANYLMVTEKLLMDQAINYKNYRTGTGFNVLLADIDELYDQFSYGIRKHPLSIRNFARYAYDNFLSPPEYLFLIGKALTVQRYRYNNTHYKNTLVPSFGVPASDNLFTTRIQDTLYRPAIATGRLAAQIPHHVRLYLNKVIEYETAQQLAQSDPQEWMKNILHFGGGSDITEQQLIKSYLSNYKAIIEDTLFGGYVRTFLKTTTAPIQINQSDSLRNIINNGVSLMTFFGHASGTGFDQSIDNPAEYNNHGLYPFLFANSCFAGDIFSTTQSSSESFVLIENKGVIGYLASTAHTPSNSLNSYAKAFYDNISHKNYGNSVGKSIQQTIQTIQNAAPGNNFIKEVCLITVLHGDPAIKLNYFEKPDYAVSSSSIFLSPSMVTTELDSFAANVIITNLGRAVDKQFVVELVREFPDGSKDTYVKQMPAPKFKDTISFTIPVEMSKAVGINKIHVMVDLFNEIDEITKVNNSATLEFLIRSPDIIPVYPPKYAVVPKNTITLKASTGDPFISQKDYIFQIDTTDLFNSPLMLNHNVSHSGGIISWDLPFTLNDSTVYYWRVALDNGQGNWRESSFQYINDKKGWGQAHYFQFKDNAYQYVTYNRPQRNFVFVNNVLSLSVQTSIYQSGSLRWEDNYYKINNAVMDHWSCLYDVGNGMKFAVFNPVSGEPWMSYRVHPQYTIGPFNNVHCKVYPVPAFDFYTTSSLWRERIKNFLDSIPNDYYVLAYNHNNHNAQNFEPDLIQAFESIGSAQISSLTNNVPYIIFGKKGQPPGTANEVIGSNWYSVITLNDSIKTKWNTGYVMSERIGPASSWGSIHWRYKSVESVSTDSVRLYVLGETINGQIDTLMSNISSDSLDIYNVGNTINAKQYPYLYLIAFMRDDVNHTPAQLTRWHVLYEGVPETALNPSLHFVFHKDTLQEGEELMFSCAIQNIGDYDMDSLLVAYWIVDKDRNIHHIPYPRQAPHPKGHVLIDTVTYSTLGLGGLNSFWIYVNPNYDQIEQYLFNNIAEIPFYVDSDRINPLLDVTFDGVHILDGDIVSAKPQIQITLRDENKFIPVDDTSSFRIFLKRPGMIDGERIYFVKNGVEQMQFFPASLPDNVCRIKYMPGILSDGTYELLVQAKDASGNPSGKIDYSITFEVINKPTITEVLNWPNPFSTSTRFVFTLTGSQIPTYMKIQIMTITGKIVREIDMSELGPIHIGRNITEFAWDGRDSFGDRLANGVYLYRVITRINDMPMELNETSASKYFNNEFGKMYLIR